MAIALSPSAVTPLPIAIASVSFALDKLPNAIAVSPLAFVLLPIAIESVLEG